MIRRFAFVFAVALAAVAVLSLVLRFALSRVGDYEDEIVARLSQAVGAEVQVGEMRALLIGVEPVVELSQVEVKPHGAPDRALRAERLRVEFDLAASLLGGRLKVSDLRILDTEFLVVTGADGRSRISGFPPVGALFGGAPGEAGGLADVGFHLERADVRWRNEQTGDEYRFENAGAAFTFREGRLRFAAKALLPSALGRFAHVAADLDGVARSGEDGRSAGWSGRVYVRADGADLERWALQTGNAGAARGVLSAELWSNWRAGELLRLDGEIACEACGVAGGETASLRTRLSWEAHEDGWRAGLLDFGWASPASGSGTGLKIRNTDAAIDHYPDRVNLAVHAPSLDAGLLAAGVELAGRLDPERFSRETFEVSAERGSVSLSAALSHSGFVPPAPLALPATGARGARRLLKDASRFASEYASAYGGLLTSLATVETARGEVGLEEVSLRVPGWSRRTFVLDRISSSLHYEGGAVPAVRAEGLSASFAGASLSGGFAWSGGGKPGADAGLTIENLPLAEIRGLLPRAGLKPGLKTWLERAFVSGVLESARVELDRGGRFRAEGRVAGATLNYQTQRRPLTALDARFVFDNRSLTVEVEHLEHYGLRSQSARVGIDDLDRPFVTVAASGAGPLAGVFDYLKDARLVNADGVVIRSLEPDGGSRLELSVGAPLSKKIDKPVSVSGALSFDDASLRVAPLDLEFAGITGVLDFDRNGGSSRSLAATLDGVPVAAEAEPAPEEGATTLKLKSALPVSRLLDLSDTPLHGAVRGTAPWEAELLIPSLREGGGYELQLRLSSALEGVAVALPPPFGKAASQRRVFSADVKLGRTNEYVLSYGDDVRAAFVRDTRAPSPALQGYLHFGAAAAPPVERGRFRIGGEISQAVEINDWFGGGRSELGPYLKHVAVTFADLRKGGAALGRTSVSIEPGAGGRELKVSAPWAQGSVFLPDADDAVVFAKMKKLLLPKSSEDGATSTLNPADLPPIEIEARELGFGDAKASGVHLVTKPSRRGMAISRLVFEAGDVVVTMSGEWMLLDGGNHRSRFRLDANGRNYGEMLRRLGVSSSLEGGDGSLTGRVTWGDRPAGFSLEKLEGNLKVSLKDGVVKEADPGISRLLGLFSIGHIVRRLSLDFRDVIEGGLAFDELEGSVNFRDSVMHTDDFIIAGPALAMSISGDSRIAEKRYDQRIDVVPNLSSSLPVAGALLAGPLAAAAVFLVDKLTDIGSKVDEVVTLRYHLHGGWDDPQVDFKGAPEVEKSPGRLKKLFDKVMP